MIAPIVPAFCPSPGRHPRKGKLFVAAFAIAAATAVAACPVRAQTLGADLNGTSPGISFQPGNYSTYGWSFSTSTSITITQFGLWDEGANGLAQSAQIALWRDSNSTLLSPVVAFPSGTAGTTTAVSSLASGVWRFVDITPIALGPGTYDIGAFFGAGTTDVSYYGTPGSIGSAVTFLGGRTGFTPGGMSMVFPGNSSTGGNFGPNFRYTVGASAPEPGSSGFLLAGITALPAFALGRRRRGAKAVP